MIQDLRFAFRLLFKSPGFSVIAILTLACGIGVNTAVFSLVHALLFQAPAYAHPAQMVQVFSQNVARMKIKPAKPIRQIQANQSPSIA